MTKKNFITLIAATFGGLLFAIGMCMCLLPEWNAFKPGVICAAVGFAALLGLFIARWKADGKHFPKVNLKAVGIGIYATVATLALGTGMCMIMVWNMMVWGIVVGVLGILLLLLLIPITQGLK